MTQAPPAKRCSRCKQEKPAAEFYRNRSRKDGLGVYCRDCGRKIWGEHEARKRRTSESFRAAKAAAAAEWRERQPDRHNTNAARHIAAKQADTVPGAKNAGRRWSGPELELALREDMNVQELATLLGRSYLAVVKARQRARTDPKYINLAGVTTSA